jgi:CheY-like chemotaxis protein
LIEVLLVDDSKADNMFHKLIIAKTGLVSDIKFAKNGQEALDMLHNKTATPDLIFLDINMPIMNGFEFLKELEKMAQQLMPKVVIMLTTSMLNEDREKTKEFSLLSDFISKPLTPDAVKKIISTHFG